VIKRSTRIKAMLVIMLLIGLAWIGWWAYKFPALALSPPAMIVRRHRPALAPILRDLAV
jgi:hypothetical protein